MKPPVQIADLVPIPTKGKKILVAVSGGLDSVVLARALSIRGYNIGIAHVNYQLRGADSQGDEAFVAALAAKLAVPFYVVRFETLRYCEQQKISIQMGARILRREWLGSLKEKHRYDTVALAHHKGDQAETVLLHLMRGSGSRGLSGMHVKKGGFWRPLLKHTKKTLQEVAQSQGWEWREDQSNQSPAYRRNRLRNEVLPLLKELNPSVEENLCKSAAILQEETTLVQLMLRQIRKQCVQEQDDLLYIHIKNLEKSQGAISFLHNLLQEYGFNYAMIVDIWQHRTGNAGHFWEMGGKRLVRDRAVFILQDVPAGKNETTSVLTMEDLQKLPVKLSVQCCAVNDFSGPYEEGVAYLDEEQLQFPLEFRKWKPGDALVPLGMHGRKKVSDFLTALKLSKTEKERIWVLCRGADVVWVVGHRIHHDYRVRSATKRICMLKII